MYAKIEKFIKENWNGTVKPPHEAEGERLALPYPYTVPSINNIFNQMYYWDTYFANVGLILSGMIDQAKNNVDNMIYLLNTYGLIPNFSATRSLNRSQPPFFSLMAREVFDVTGDKDWLENKVYPALCIEYDFWETKRKTNSGLNFYTANVTDEGRLVEFAEYLCRRFVVELPEDKKTQLEWGKSMFALCECGWDCSSRFGFTAHKTAPICLASLLYALEKNAAYFAEVLGKADDVKLWNNRAEARRQKVNELLWNDDLEVFDDINYETGKHNGIVSVGTFYPLFTGLATDEQADKIMKALSVLETEYGLAACEKRDDLLNLQWDYPHGWACLHHITIQGLLNYGKTDDALRIAEKYAKLVASTFDETGNLWEKYDVIKGTVAATIEAHYETPTMLGWSAGVFLYCYDLLKKNGLA